MALFIPDMAGHLFLVILLFDTFQSIKAQVPPQLTVSPEVIRVTDTVQLRCHTSQSTYVSQCYFYIEKIHHLQHTTSCQQSLTGTKLLEWAGHGPTTKVNMRCIYYAVEMSIYSPYSDPVSVTLLGKLQKPDISVNDESSHDITIACVLPESVSDGHSCNMYTGDQPQAYKEAWVRRFNAASSKLFCTFSVTKNDLFRHLQLERDVSCDYRVNTGSHSLSPRSDKYIITGQKPNITVSLKGNLIITCLIPGSVSNDTTCNLYVGEKSKCLFRARIWKKKHKDSECWFCQFSAAENDLISCLQSVRRKEVSCDYRVSSGPNSLSPRSDWNSFTLVLTPGPRSTLLPSKTASPTEDTIVRPTTSLTSPLTPSTAVNPTSGLTSPLAPSTAVNHISGGQSSTDSIVNSNSQKRVWAVQLWQAAVCMASGVGMFWMGLTVVYLWRRTKKTNSLRPTARQDDHRQCDLVMGAMSSAGMLDSRDAGIYSLITSVPSTFLHSGPVQQSANEDADSENAGVYSLITSVPSTSVPLGPFE
uniref:uncharacterized protein LOC124004292 isoform X4 n=1 Tax=Oncorhynchus gorbuscha TaxID=8017 RepID=UPI001EAF19DA|nr:uncharacterized protein LOC124004292 isoform X4 [Oncorhynchus gorbuscha]